MSDRSALQDSERAFHLALAAVGLWLKSLLHQLNIPTVDKISLT